MKDTLLSPLNITTNETNFTFDDNSKFNTTKNDINKLWNEEINDYDLKIDSSEEEEVFEKPVVVEQFIWNWFRTLDKIVLASFMVSVLPIVFSLGIVARVCRNKVRQSNFYVKQFLKAKFGSRQFVWCSLFAKLL